MPLRTVVQVVSGAWALHLGWKCSTQECFHVLIVLLKKWFEAFSIACCSTSCGSFVCIVCFLENMIECNKEEAFRAREIAIKKIGNWWFCCCPEDCTCGSKDVSRAWRYIYPICQLSAIFTVQPSQVCGGMDWYGVFQLEEAVDEINHHTTEIPQSYPFTWYWLKIGFLVLNLLWSWYLKLILYWKNQWSDIFMTSKRAEMYSGPSAHTAIHTTSTTSITWIRSHVGDA